MKKERIHIPMPKSSFLLVQCADCGNEQTIFSHSSTIVHCKVCNAQLTKSTGGKALLNGQILRRLD